MALSDIPQIEHLHGFLGACLEQLGMRPGAEQDEPTDVPEPDISDTDFTPNTQPPDSRANDDGA